MCGRVLGCEHSKIFAGHQPPPERLLRGMFVPSVNSWACPCVPLVKPSCSPTVSCCCIFWRINERAQVGLEPRTDTHRLPVQHRRTEWSMDAQLSVPRQAEERPAEKSVPLVSISQVTMLCHSLSTLFCQDTRRERKVQRPVTTSSKQDRPGHAVTGVLK